MSAPAILIIDDDANTRRTLADILRLKGYETRVAMSGREGLEWLSREPFNVVLIDLGLPDISGLEVLKGVKAVRPSAQAIILTGNATLDSAIEATNRGAFSYLRKPCDIEQLAISIKRAIEKQQADAQIVSHSAELQRSNADLKALHEVGQVIGRTLDRTQLLADILTTLVDIDILGIERKGRVFLMEGDALRLASSIGLPGPDLGPCHQVPGGRCLCGTAAVTGEVVVCRSAASDPRHLACCGWSSPHGHVVVPLMAVNRVVGVLCLYTEPDREVDDRSIGLLVAIGRQLGIAIENTSQYEATKSSSLHDPLTGLANRRFLQVQMEKNLDVVKRYGDSLSVIMLDIDNFKDFNDAFGHLEGDRLLVSLAGILVETLRSADSVFRYGGEEFLVLLPKTDGERASGAAERLRSAVARGTKITISLGVASTTGTAPMDVIDCADKALYRAKQRGRNRVEVYGDDSRDAATNHHPGLDGT